MNHATEYDESDAAPAWLRWVTRISLVFGIGALVATVAFVGPSTILAHLETIGGWFAVLIAMEAASACCDAGAIYLMTRGPGAPDWRRVLVALFAGRAVNTVTPGGNLGEALKVGLLARHCPTQRVLAAILFVVLTAFTISLLMIAAGTGATAWLFEIPRPASYILGGAAAATGVAALVILVLIRKGMLSALARTASRVGLLSKKRLDSWTRRLADLDNRLRGKVGAQNRAAAGSLVLVSQLIQKGITWVAIVAAGYELRPGQLIAIMSAGVIIGWVSTLIPMGLGILEGGNVALFSLIGAPVSLGVALALARRVNQVVFASIGFVVLSVDKVASTVRGHIKRLPASTQEVPVRS